VAEALSANSRLIHEKTSEHDGETGNQPVSPSDQTLLVELREEELVAEKQLVHLGVVRIRRRLVTETRTIELPVTREELMVEHLPVETISSSELEAAAMDQLQPALAEQLRALQLGETLRLPIAKRRSSFRSARW
jgi:stress response protein YsnF